MVLRVGLFAATRDCSMLYHENRQPPPYNDKQVLAISSVLCSNIP